MKRLPSSIRWLPAALLALLVSFGAVTASTACAVAGPDPVSVSAPDDCGHESDAAFADCARHCALICAAVRPAPPSVSAAVSAAAVAYLVQPVTRAGVALMPERPPPR